MGREYASDTLWRAQELYCVDRLSYAAVAEQTGVSATTLKAWGQKYDWARKRAEIAQAESEIRINTVKSRHKALEQLLTAGDAKEAAQMAFAVSSLESLALKQQELAAAGKIPSATPPVRRKISTKAEAVAALKEAVEKKLNLALADADKISAALVSDVKRCLELVTDFENSLPKETKPETAQGLSAEMAAKLRELAGVG